MEISIDFVSGRIECGMSTSAMGGDPGFGLSSRTSSRTWLGVTHGHVLVPLPPVTMAEKALVACALSRACAVPLAAMASRATTRVLRRALACVHALRGVCGHRPRRRERLVGLPCR